MVKYYVAAFLAVFLTAVSQLLFKLGANRAHRRHVVFVYANPYSLTAYCTLLAVTVLYTYALQQMPLKFSAVMLPLANIFVGLFSVLFLKEKITRHQLIGALLIIAGIFIFNLNLA